MGVQIRLEQVQKTFYLGKKVEVHAVRGVDLTVEEGEMICLMGSSGSGKSTLLNLIAGLDRPTGGSIWVEGEEITRLTENQLCLFRRRKLGFVFQSFNLLPLRTALENVEMPLIFAGVSRPERRYRAREMLESVGLGNRLDHRPTELSGGQQQRVAVARALVNRPGIILADEPTGNLDTASGEELMKIMGDLNKNMGVTFIIATHDREVASYAQRVVTLRDGLIVKVTAGAEV